MSRELSRRLAALERDRGGERVRYVVSDRAMTQEQWDATKDGADINLDEPEELSPIMTEVGWIAKYGCQIGSPELA